jgi:cysteine sulfinate desulfinase/cysteine desulfurase-like protein
LIVPAREITVLDDIARRQRCGAAVSVDSRGRLDMAAFQAALGPRTAIASIMWANNDTGTLFKELAALTRAARSTICVSECSALSPGSVSNGRIFEDSRISV